jgi:hypothetical protein
MPAWQLLNIKRAMHQAHSTTAPRLCEDSHHRQVRTHTIAGPSQVGLPDHSEALEANLEYQLHASHGDLRGFLATAAESRDLGEFSDVLGAALRSRWCSCLCLHREHASCILRPPCICSPTLVM